MGDQTPIKNDPPASVRWGLIGVGDIVRKRAGAALMTAPGSTIAAVAAAHPARAEAYAREIGAAAWHTDWRDLVRDPGIDAVYIATPVAFHAEQARSAAAAGKHVLCEKPLAMNAEHGRAIIDACRKRGVILGTAYYRRYYPIVKRIREIISGGELGPPVIAQLNAFSPFDPGPGHPRAWLLQKKLSGGGPLKDFGCHRIELLLHLFDAGELAGSAAATLRREREVEDTAALMLRFSGGLVGMLAVSHTAAEAADTLDIYCASGSLHVPALNQDRLRIVTRGGGREESHPPPSNLHFPLVADFVRAVGEGGPFAVSGEIGLAVDEIIDQVYHT